MDGSRAQRRELFAELQQLLLPDVRFKIDGHEHYATLIKCPFIMPRMTFTKAQEALLLVKGGAEENCVRSTVFN